VQSRQVVAGLGGGLTLAAAWDVGAVVVAAGSDITAVGPAAAYLSNPVLYNGVTVGGIGLGAEVSTGTVSPMSAGAVAPKGAAEGEKLLFRRGPMDTKKLLESQAQAAENALGIHGVSVSTSSAAKAGQVVRCATCSSVEAAGFGVQQTGKDPNHHTVELPRPITSDVVRIWNDLFK